MAEIRIKDNESLDSALRRFKKQCARSGVIAEVRKREAYEKPSVKRKKKSEVETRGIEPLSESTSTRISPGAVCQLTFLPQCAGKQAHCFRRVILHDGRNS